MKILIAYDGSVSAESAIDDLKSAGLANDNVEAHILSVAEVWLPPQNGNGSDDYPIVVQKWTRKRREIAKNAVKETERLCGYAENRLRNLFPGWKVSGETASGSPAWEILAHADSFGADLIVVGAQGKDAVNRFLLGSISQKVLTEAKCSVRIGRGKIQVDPSPNRILIGFDGSPGSIMAADKVSRRFWADGSELCLLTSVHSSLPAAIGRFVSPVKDWIGEDDEIEFNWIREVSEPVTKKLQNAGLSVKNEKMNGNPKRTLVEYAASWGADTIFVGAHSYTVLERFLIGTTSSAVAERASCSVEVVRD